MARKEIEVVISGSGRDQGKTFRITEMTPVQFDKWALRCVTLAGLGTVDPWQAFKKLLATNFALVEPLLDEMLSCITPLDDIEEISTLWALRMKVIALHSDIPDAPVVPEEVPAGGRNGYHH